MLSAIIIMSVWLWISHPASAAEIIIQHDFSKITNIESDGWKCFPGQGTEFNLQDGCLRMLFANAPYKGGNINRTVPQIDSGSLIFEVAVDTNGTGYDHFSLKINLCNLLLAFKQTLGTGHKLIRFYDGKWKDVADNIPVGKKIKVKIVFDNSTKVVQYFVDDMDNPVMIDENMTIASPGPSASLLIIGNYGLATGKLEHKMFNIVLSR